MLWGTVALVVGTVAPWLALPAKGTLEGMLLISSIAHLMPWLQVSIMIPTWGLFLVYAWFWLRINRKKKSTARYPQQEITETNFGAIFGQSVRKF
jgi:hypothetical protein